MRHRNNRHGEMMSSDDRRLIVEALAEMRELKGEMREFKEHVIGRVERLEQKEGERSKERISITSILISAGGVGGGCIQ